MGVNREYYVTKIDKQLFDQIAVYKFNSNEVGSIRQKAMTARASNLKISILSAAMAVVALAFLFGPQGMRDFFSGSMAFFPKLMGLIMTVNVVLRLYKASINMRYINAINNNYTKEREERINAIISELATKTMVSTVTLTARYEPVTVFSSKLGGTPYLPPGFLYPQASNGRPLRLLAQLNFEELPKLTDFPETGILQFYATDDDVYGIDFSNLTSQRDFRVAYHENIIKDESVLGTLPESDDEESLFPFMDELALSGEMEQMPITAVDFRFEEQLLSLYNSAFSLNISRLGELPGDVWDTVFETFNTTGHRIGGYPFFTQTDPRDDQGSYSGHTVLLLQIDSIGDVMWGDAGVGNFFISPQKLKAKDFSDVLYTWDCY